MGCPSGSENKDRAAAQLEDKAAKAVLRQHTQPLAKNWRFEQVGPVQRRTGIHVFHSVLEVVRLALRRNPQ